MSDRSDGELVRAAQNGDRLAWELVIGRHAERLAAYLGARLRRPDVVEKLVADTILMAWKHLDDIEAADGFAPWFRRLGANLALRWHKQHKGESLVGDLPGTGDEQLRALDRALGQLPEAQRLVLEHRFRGGLRGVELAEALHSAEGACDAAVDHALSMLDAVLRAGR